VERLPVPFSIPERKPLNAPTCTNPFNSGPWVILSFKQKPISVAVFQKPIHCFKISFFDDHGVNFAFAAWGLYAFGKGR
jgi:hypothetical protein